MRRLFLVVVLIFLICSPCVQAQKPDERFELGQRLRAFEADLETQSDTEARKRALTILKPATMTFFMGRNGDVALLLDRARFALASNVEPALEVRWATSLYAQPSAKLLDTKSEKLPLTIRAIYPVKDGPVEKAQVRLSLVAAGKVLGMPYTVDLKKLPLECELPLKGLDEGDQTLRCEMLLGDKVLAKTEQAISFVKNLSQRLEKIQVATKELAKQEPTTDIATLTMLVELLSQLDAKKPQETNYPAARLLAEAEGVISARQAGEPYYGRKKTGQFWLTLATTRPAPVRLLAPTAAKKGEPLPLLVALHGAGGSENMFFDGYGNGLIAKLCEERGWLLVTTRNGQIAGVVDEVDKLYPVDKKRVFLVGHSMGAAQAVAAVSAKPEQFAAVAALGGGGGFKTTDALKAVPFFIGVGKEDFALGGARGLETNLKKAEVKTVEMKEYPDVEHVTVVQLALRDVFAFFETAAKKNTGGGR